MPAPCSNNAGRGTPFLRPRGFCSSRTSQRGRVGPPAPKLKLEPAPATVPAPTEENQHYQDDDEKGGGVHVALPGRDAVYVSDWCRTGWVSSSASRLLNERWPNFVPTSDSAPVTLLMLLNARRLDHLDRVVRAGSHLRAVVRGTTSWYRHLDMTQPKNWPQNRLLLALPSSNLKRLMTELKQVPCQHGQILMDADGSLDNVFFPDSGVISVVAVYADGSIIEMATVGREGCTGFQAFFGEKESSVRLLVQISGSASKLSRAAFARAMQSLPSFRNLMSANVHAFLEQVLVSVACNGAHTVKQRLARWLLMMRDRSDADTLPITQTVLAEMLGVQRPTITHAIRDLEQGDLIEPGRGQVTVRDRQGLMQASCECYQLVRTRTAFRLPKTYS